MTKVNKQKMKERWGKGRMLERTNKRGKWKRWEKKNKKWKATKREWLGKKKIIIK